MIWQRDFIQNDHEVTMLTWIHRQHCSSDDPHDPQYLNVGPLHSPIRSRMKPNMGSLDRTIRIIAAVIIGALYFTNTITGTFGILLLLLAAVFLLTSGVSFCPLYAPFKISTRKP